MLTDPYNRTITYLRVSVTDRCNFRCVYCMPPEGVELKSHAEILRHEEILRVVAEAARLGVTKVRLTGGEPLLRRNIEFLVKGIASTRGIEETCMSTNGSLLKPRTAQALKAAGLTRVNVSLDTLEGERFRQITREGALDDVLRGIDAAVEAGLTPVKINMVLFPETTEAEIAAMREFCASRGARLQTINRFSLGNRHAAGTHVADRPPPCADCNRLRLTADGYLKPCLFSEHEIKVDMTDIRGSILRAVQAKPRSGEACRNRAMSQIGG
jgi:cyclic pyranopterin phosphate synthase